jgi:cell division protein FtsB
MVDDVAVVTRRGRLVLLLEDAMPALLGRRRAATVAVALLALGVGYHVIFGANGLNKYEQKRHETQMLNQEMLQLRHENDLLTGHVARLQSDPNAIEQQAREQLRYTRPGEVIYTLPDK